jgi:hypothetical protein
LGRGGRVAFGKRARRRDWTPYCFVIN